jgi:hypothetical protein
MEADDLPCSRNARSPKTFVEHAQWETIQPALKGEDSQENIPGTLFFIQCACEQLQHHVVTNPGRSRIVAGTFVTKKGVCSVELMPLEMHTGLTQLVVDQHPALAGNMQVLPVPDHQQLARDLANPIHRQLSCMPDPRPRLWMSVA